MATDVTKSILTLLRKDLGISKDIRIWVERAPCVVMDAGADVTENEDDSYTIRIGSLYHVGSYAFCELMAHEMKHVQQYERGMLRTPTFKSFYWRGKRLYYKHYPYTTEPYEVEAYAFAAEWAKKNYKKFSKRR